MFLGLCHIIHLEGLDYALHVSNSQLSIQDKCCTQMWDDIIKS